MNECLLEKLINNGTPDMYAAFAETVKQEIASDEDTYESIGYNLLKALLTGTADDISVTLCGWYVDTLLAKARIVPDVKEYFYPEPLDAYIVTTDNCDNECFTPCKVNMQTFEVYDINGKPGADSPSDESTEKYIAFGDMEDYRFPLKPKDEVFDPDCYDESAEFDYTNKEAPVQSKPIGRIDYLHTDGRVRESIEYTSPYQFEKDIKEENYYGVPMKIVLYKDRDGTTISQDFISQLDPQPQGVEIIDSQYSEIISYWYGESK